MSSRYVARRKNYYRGYIPKSVKYQFVPFTIQGTIPQNQQFVYKTIVPRSNVAGIRKVKNFDITMSLGIGDSGVIEPILYALMYVPEGANVAQIVPQLNQPYFGEANQEPPFVEMLAANQWVIGCGCVTTNSTTRYRSRLSRNLNDGDSVVLIFWQTEGVAIDEKHINATGNYAIRYN